MRFNKKDFNEFILSEVQKVSKDENLSLVLKENTQNIEECGCEQEDSEGGEVSFLDSDNFEEVNPEEFMEEAVEVKQLSEELLRMKNLLSFNNPLLKL